MEKKVKETTQELFLKLYFKGHTLRENRKYCLKDTFNSDNEEMSQKTYVQWTEITVSCKINKGRSSNKCADDKRGSVRDM